MQKTLQLVRMGSHSELGLWVRIGNVMLGNLPLGQWRYLAPHEKF